MKKIVKIPKRITPDPILEAVVEFRFIATIPTDAIFGLVYSKLLQDFPDYEALPILQLPEVVRNNDLNFEFAPHYKFKNERYQINVGPKVIAIINPNPYSGWNDYYDVIQKIIKDLAALNFIKTITRIGVRYIDFFDKINIFDHLEFNVVNFPFSSDQTSFATTFLHDNFITNLQVSNANQILVNGDQFSGSIFDSDTYIEEAIEFDQSEILKVINSVHNLEKKIFYTLIKNEFIATLNPEYD